MPARIGRHLDFLIDRLVDANPWTNVYGAARSLLALSTLLSLSFTAESVLFTPSLDIQQVPMCGGVSGRISLFCVLEPYPALARWLAAAILLVVASGWRPRVTAAFHWWVCFSLVTSLVLVDGGDHVSLVLSSLLLPIALTDSRRSHFSRSDQGPPVSDGESVRRLIAHSARIMIRVQVAVLYLHAAFAKAGVVEWQNGTALYYWLADPQFGAPRWIQSAVLALLRIPYVVAPLTWAVMAFEFALFAGLLARREYRSILLVAALVFHFGIAMLHGLVSFSIAMAGALILFLRPFDDEFWLRSRVGQWWSRDRTARTVQKAGGVAAFH